MRVARQHMTYHLLLALTALALVPSMAACVPYYPHNGGARHSEFGVEPQHTQHGQNTYGQDGYYYPASRAGYYSSAYGAPLPEYNVLQKSIPINDKA